MQVSLDANEYGLSVRVEAGDEYDAETLPWSIIAPYIIAEMEKLSKPEEPRHD